MLALCRSSRRISPPCSRKCRFSIASPPRRAAAFARSSISIRTSGGGAAAPRARGMPRGDAERGEHGTACLPGREQRFRDDLERAIAYARTVGCAQLHCMAGVAPAGLDRALVHAAYVSNLKHAAPRLRAQGMRLLIEPLSPRTVAGCFLTGSAQAVQVLDEVAAGNA